MKTMLAAEGLTESPEENLTRWLEQAQKSNFPEPTAMTLATVNSSGMPRARVVLFKGWSTASSGIRGPSFYTNYDSAKSGEIKTHAAASLCFFWVTLGKQIRIEGTLEKVSPKESDDYFQSRPRESQIGAWASLQSHPIPNRKWLEDRFLSFEQKFKDQPVPRPENWGGFVLKPTYYEFWIGRPSRLHDRIRFQMVENKWEIDLLSP